jgi:hypothetical protein
MKRRPQLVTVLLCIVFFLGAACWYWLSEEDASIESPALSPSIEAPPGGNSNVAANPPPRVISQNLAPPPGLRSQQEVVGIGAVLKTDANTGAIMITGTVPNSPAAAAGLSGDFLVRKIDDVATDGMKLPECVNLIRGPVGSKVRLELFDLDAHEAKTVELTRQKLQL